MAFGAVQGFTALVWLGVGLSCANHTPPSSSREVRAASAPSRVGAQQRASALPVSTANAGGVALLVPRSKLRVGTSGDYAPFSTRDPTGKVRGFDAEVADALAQDLGFDLEWVAFRWPTLQSQVQSRDFDVAMSGVTWQPTRAVTGYLTRAVARGGPCVLGDEGATRVAVNRGGVLEAWARAHFAGRELLTVDDNRTLPELLATGNAGAIVTDSFERKAFERPGWSVRCEPALARKVYWVAPDRAELATRIEGWLRTHSARIQNAQQRWFGEQQELDALGNLTDLLARRMAFMPLVAAAKAKLGIPIEDLPREQIVLDSAAASAHKVALPEAQTRAFFGLQIELSKAVQRRRSEPTSLDLAQQIRPALNDLGERILVALAEARGAGQLANCSVADLESLSPWLNAAELQQLRDNLRAFAQ